MAKKQSSTGSNDTKTKSLPAVKGASISRVPTVDEAEALAQSGGMLGELLKKCGGALILIHSAPPEDKH